MNAKQQIAIDNACLDAGCDIDGNEPHKPHCDNAPLPTEDTTNG